MAPIQLTDIIPELYFGLVRAIGTSIDSVRSDLVGALRDAGFSTKADQGGEIRISKLFKDVAFLRKALQESSDLDRYRNYMDAGDLLRGLTKRADAAALLGAKAIRASRSIPLGGKAPQTSRGRAYVLRSLMHPEEVETLRKVYGSQYFTIGVFSPREEREVALSRTLSASCAMSAEEMRPKAVELINREDGLMHSEDSMVDPKYRLDVRRTYQKADLFVSATDPESSQKAIRRFVELIFSQPFITPNRDEFGMALAYASSVRSGDLSRRVGACALGDDGEVLATGTNEVPKFGGGFYWPNDSPDGRDLHQGGDHSDRVRRELLTDVVRRVTSLEQPKSGGKWTESDLEKAVQGVLQSRSLRQARALDVVEYSRAVHAEMAVITDAARRGIPLRGADLFCTTFPCHECARLIVAAGFKRVVYIEPYPKSRVAEMYADSIGLADKQTALGKRVRFEPFIGIAPRRFSDLFSWVTRKSSDSVGADWMSGKPVSWSLATGEIRPSILDSESHLSGARSAGIEAGENYLIGAFDKRLQQIAEEISKSGPSPNS